MFKAPLPVIQFVESMKLKYKVFKSTAPYKLVVGSSGIQDKGWIGSDIFGLNILKEDNWRFYFKEDSLQNIMGEHVWEHLTQEDGAKAAENCYKFLQKGGTLRIAVPDGYHVDQKYIDFVKPGGNGIGADDHKVLYNYQSLGKMLEEIGFKVTPVEYFDEEKHFVTSDWSLSHGKIRRSLQFDERNKDGNPNYTSLIVDATKI